MFGPPPPTSHGLAMVYTQTTEHLCGRDRVRKNASPPPPASTVILIIGICMTFSGILGTNLGDSSTQERWVR